ncbi:TonB-dependent receptor [Flammeovirgaceae bacterium SG7u.111]|nr:TonB-dependent receptor [Flammeovirgaceae bacterium SG7u.132]WPO37602.1 TonB-dependent receptor [Flammeovirgaceae bacterium SG7u.111]
MKRLYHFLLVFLFLLPTSAFAQGGIVKGKIVSSDNSEPLPGAAVIIKGTSRGATTDIDGNFAVEAASSDVLVISYIGYETQEIPVGSQTMLNITLQLDIQALDEVVVIGYGTQTKKEVTGAVGSVKSEDLVKMTTSDLGTALQGQIAGVNVTSSSGAPGAEANILIRGFSSLMDGQNSPLYVVDGIPFDNDPQLSMAEIESVDILKDAASASIYGTRGAGGVILITTKKGKAGATNVQVSAEYGIQRIQSEFNNMSVEEYNYIHSLRGTINTGRVQGGAEEDIHRNKSYFTNNTDIGEVLLQDNAPIQNYSIGLSGGKEGLTYSFNLNYFDQGGVFYNSGFKRLNVRSNNVYTKGKVKITTGLMFRTDERQVPYGGMMNRIYEYRPFQPEISLDDDALGNASEISLDDPTDDWKLDEARRLANAARLLKTDETRRQNSFTGNVQFDYEVLKGLKLTTRFGGTANNSKWDKIIPRFDIFNTEGELITNPNAYTSNTVTDILNTKITSEFFVTYNKKIGKHRIRLLGQTSFERSSNERFQLEMRNNLHPAVTVLDNYELIWDVGSGGQDYTRVLLGNTGRFQYDYDGKYLLSASARYDGSSQFSDGRRWALFPSVSVGWSVSDEPFWQGLKPSFNSFKLRASYGSTGNDRFSTYSNQTVVSAGNDFVFGSNNASGDVNGAGVEEVALGTTQLQYANVNLGWETNVEQNFGVDMGFFNDKLTVAVDLYKNEKEDLLYQVVNPPSTGVSGGNRNTIFNVGNMENKGVEIGANYKYLAESGFNMTIGATYTNNTNLITKTSPNNPIIYLDNSYISTAGTREQVSVLTEGYEAAAFFLRDPIGIIKTEEELEAYRRIDPSAQMGELQYRDVNGDSTIDANDRVYAGSGVPDFEAGLNITMGYKNFDFTMQWYGSWGAEVMNGSKAYAYQSGTHKDIYYSWTQHNTEADVPWYDGNNTRSYRGGSAYFMEKGDFIRLRNIALGYTIPKKIANKAGIRNVRIYVQAQNPITITDYTGFDPEVGGNGLSTRGIDQGRYPMSSQYKGGLQFQF